MLVRQSKEDGTQTVNGSPETATPNNNAKSSNED